ncbi:MAG: hypothetical protein AABX96_05165 [Nanoarchaeota archaeon]
MTGIIFDIKALREYVDRLKNCQGDLHCGYPYSTLEKCSMLRTYLDGDNRFENSAKQVIKKKIESLELKATDFILKGNLTNNNPTPPYDGAS